jgi:hypothetical protein
MPGGNLSFPRCDLSVVQADAGVIGDGWPLAPDGGSWQLGQWTILQGNTPGWYWSATPGDAGSCCVCPVASGSYLPAGCKFVMPLGPDAGGFPGKEWTFPKEPTLYCLGSAP